jgi:molybdenum cofactor cytidylyltransferase
MAEVSIVLLAAGGSKRMGQPKQLLQWGNKLLIEHQIQILQKTGCPLIVVLGAYHNNIVPLIEKSNITIIINDRWETGMGSSIAAGIRSVLLENPLPEGVLIALLDQPMVPAEHFNRMIAEFQPGKQHIIVSRSSTGWEGVPVLFDNFYFEELKALSSEPGAKKIIHEHREKVLGISCDEILDDIDTPETYRKLLGMFSMNS